MTSIIGACILTFIGGCLLGAYVVLCYLESWRDKYLELNAPILAEYEGEKDPPDRDLFDNQSG